MTILSEERVVAGDQLYDPSLPDDQQVFKATYQFTDKMYNMDDLVSGKKEIRTPVQVSVTSISYVSTTATAVVASGHGILDSNSVTITGVTDDTLYNGTFTVSNVTATTFDYTLSDTPSTNASNSGITATFTKISGTDHDSVTGLYFGYTGTEPAGTPDEKKQVKDKIVLQTRKELSGSDHMKMTFEPLETKMEAVDTSNVSKSSLLLTQSKQELTFTGEGLFSIDNSTKSLLTSMETLEFGPSSQKHRLAVKGAKLFIQKWDGSSWVGADIVIDATSAYTATLSITATNTSQGKIDVTATLSGTYDHWHVKLDDGSESMAMTGNTFQLDSTYIGSHQVVAYAADSSHAKVSEYAIFSITTTQ
jgi:hypothetical protein